MSFFDNHYLFSETYIKEYIEQQKHKDITGQDILNKYKTIKEWHDECSDTNWFTDFIRPVLDTMGFKYPPVKDNIIILYTNPPASGDRPVAVLYAVSKGFDLDSKKKGKYYAFNAVKAAKENGVEWAMLTNGYKWRVYNTRNVSPYENYLEVDIENSVNNMESPDEAFTLFNLFFNVRTYYREDDGELVIEKIKEKSDKKAEQIEDFLRGKAEEILKDLCYGFKENMGYEKYDRTTCRMIYQDAITLLFRMLFFGYAESRGLLPCNQEDVDYRNNSFFKLCEEAKDVLNQGKAHEIKNGFDFWDRLDEHLRIYVDRTYNGGLFDNSDKPILREYRIANGWLIKCLAEIAYKKDRKTNSYIEKIEYKDLSVRNLGSIYEGLLEFNLFIADERMVKRISKGKVQYLKTRGLTLRKSDEPNIIEPGDIYLSQDATERKDTGSYYTPEDVVEYIVSNTVGRKLEELKNELKELLKTDFDALAYEPTDSGKKRIQRRIDEETVKFIEDKVLSLSVIDSAMGSGHFLVNAAYRLANGIVDILCENNWESDEDIYVDIGHWKRRVVENCIYGIDINPLAVMLAKLSLWLISASNDKALSFIDHHLKVGNSIIGTDRHHVKVKNEKYPIFEVSYENYMDSVMKKYKELKKTGSATREDVKKQQEIHDEINQMLELVKKKYDYYLASLYAGGIQDEMKFADVLRSKDINDFKTEEMEPLWKIAEEKKFFHWELEFPEVFLKGGFDVVIGNPPYVDVQDTEFRYSVYYTLSSRNLYAYMMENSIEKSKNGGVYGFIIPLSLVTSPKMISIKNYVIKRSRNIWINSYSIRPAKIFQNVDQRVCIVYGSKDILSECVNIYTTKYIMWNSNQRKQLFNNVEYASLTYPHNMSNFDIYKVGTDIELSILKKLNMKEHRIGDYLLNNDGEISEDELENHIFYHSAVRYWIKALNFIPEFINEGVERQSSKYKPIHFAKKINKNIPLALLNTSLFFWYWIITSDCRDLMFESIQNFRINMDEFDDKAIATLEILCENLMKSYIDNSEIKTCNMATIGQVSYREFHPKYSKEIIDKIDDVFAKHYGFTQEECEFIKSYEIKFRMGE